VTYDVDDVEFERVAAARGLASLDLHWGRLRREKTIWTEEPNANDSDGVL